MPTEYVNFKELNHLLSGYLKAPDKNRKKGPKIGKSSFPGTGNLVRCFLIQAKLLFEGEKTGWPDPRNIEEFIEGFK